MLLHHAPVPAAESLQPRSGGKADRQRGKARPWQVGESHQRPCAPKRAVTSISSFISGRVRPHTTMVAAGRISANTSPATATLSLIHI